MHALGNFTNHYLFFLLPKIHFFGILLVKLMISRCNKQNSYKTGSYDLLRRERVHIHVHEHPPPPPFSQFINY